MPAATPSAASSQCQRSVASARRRQTTTNRQAQKQVSALAAVPVRPSPASIRSGYQTSPQTDAPTRIARVGSADRSCPFISAHLPSFALLHRLAARGRGQRCCPPARLTIGA